MQFPKGKNGGENMKRKGLIIGLAVALMMTGCSNTQKADTNTVESSASLENERTVSQMTDKEVIDNIFELLGKDDEQSKDFFGGSEVNKTSDGDYLIGRIYNINIFGEETQLFTSYDANGIVNSINFMLADKSVEEYSSAITEVLGQPTEVNDTPTEGGSTYTLWTIGDDLFYLYSGYDVITVQLIRPDIVDTEGLSESEIFAEGIVKQMAEKKAYPELEELIIKEYDIPEEFREQTKYYYNYVDLNGDGVNEIFVVIMGPYTSGSGGSSAMVVIPAGGVLNVNQKLTLVNTPVIISDRITRGVHEIIALRSGGGADTEYVRLTASEGTYTNISDGEVLESLNGVTGTAIIANDILKDMEDGNILTLSKK